MYQAILKRVSLAVVTVVTVIAIWELSGLLFSGTNPFPPPSHFLPRIFDSHLQIGIGAQATSIPAACLLSILRVAVGMILGVSIALLLAVVIASSTFTYHLFFPVIQFFGPIAPVAWIPLALLLFGIGNGTAVFIVVMGVVFLLTLAFTGTLRQQILKYSEFAISIGANRPQQIFFISLPAAAPQLITSIRVNFLAAWVALLAGEMTGLGSGLGAIVMLGRNLYDYNLVALGVFLIAILGFLTDLIFQLVQEAFFWW